MGETTSLIFFPKIETVKMSSVRLVDGRQIVLFHKDGNGNTIGRQNAEILTENFGDGQCGLQGRGDVTANLGFTIFVGNRAYTIPACEMNLPENVLMRSIRVKQRSSQNLRSSSLK